MGIHWETEIAELLTELSSVQEELLAFLAEKRRRLIASDLAQLAELHGPEERLAERLQNCHDRRARLLAQAAEESRPADSLRSLARSLGGAERKALEAQVQRAEARSRLLRHQSLTNWVVVQRSLLHLSQMLEIIATGGRQQPTYGKGESLTSGGALLDQAA